MNWDSFADGVLMTIAVELILIGVAMVIRSVYHMGFEDGRGSLVNR